MAAVTWGSELLRLDRGTWERYGRIGTTRSAVVVAIGAYAVLAFDRFGFFALYEPRPSVRLVLVGFYGWLGLAGATWAIAHLAGNRDTSFGLIFRLFGFAHLPLMVVAITIQFTSMLLQVLGPALVVALLVATLWMPWLLIVATSEAFEVDRRRAIVLVTAPYVLWLLVVGRILAAQVGHLL